MAVNVSVFSLYIDSEIFLKKKSFSLIVQSSGVFAKSRIYGAPCLFFLFVSKRCRYVSIE
jgi:hypothetical protein